MSGNLWALALLVSIQPSYQQWYPGATYVLPDGREIASPALPPPDKRGSATVQVTWVDSPYVPEKCGGEPGEEIYACTWPRGEMILPNPCDARYHNDTYAVLVCHEKGHVLGWEHD